MHLSEGSTCVRKKLLNYVLEPHTSDVVLVLV